MSTTVHHIAVAVRDLDEALVFYRDALGLEVITRREVPKEGVEIALLASGEAEIELIQPLDDEGGVARFLEKHGEGLHHLCLKVDDIDQAIARVREMGGRLLSEEPQVGPEGERYVFIHPRSAHGVLLELYEVGQ
jgi:methylmalonyl-CoA/ethylmalonyl-CoA epimerase